MTNLVRVVQKGGIYIGPLTREQYQVILDSLELAAAWTERDSSPLTARALRSLIPPMREIVADPPTLTSGPSDLRDQLPEPIEVIEIEIDEA